MITALDHVVLVCPSIEQGAQAYAAIFGRDPDWRAANPAGGVASAVFQTANCALELMAPMGSGPVAERLRAILDRDGPGLQTLAFATKSIVEAHRIATPRRPG
jgi:4-hydroxyphenylpyruvate dioxygenase-like putative hemolysin